MPASQMYQATYVLNNAAIKLLPTAGPEVIPAPGAGRMLVFMSAYVLCDCQAGAYVGASGGNDNLAFYVNEQVSNYLVNGGGFGSNFEILFTDTEQVGGVWFAPLALAPSAGGNNYTDSPKDSTGMTNQPMLLIASTASGNFTGGNAANTLKAIINYTIIDV